MTLSNRREATAQLTKILNVIRTRSVLILLCYSHYVLRSAPGLAHLLCGGIINTLFYKGLFYDDLAKFPLTALEKALGQRPGPDHLYAHLEPFSKFLNIRKRPANSVKCELLERIRPAAWLRGLWRIPRLYPWIIPKASRWDPAPYRLLRMSEVVVSARFPGLAPVSCSPKRVSTGTAGSECGEVATSGGCAILGDEQAALLDSR